MRTALLIAFAAATLAATTTPDALELKAREWAAKGFVLKDRIERPVDGLPVAAAVYSPKDGSGGDRLEAYVVVKDKAYLGYSHPAATERLELEASPEGRGLRDLLGDGSRAFAYRATIRALNATALVVVRYRSFKFAAAGQFPEGRFLRAGDQTLVLARDLPLGRFLAVGCEDFGTVSQTAFRTRLYAARGGRFVDVSSRHPDLYATEIARKEEALARLKGDLQKNAGEYLGLALSAYYDYAARGEARKGWERQKEYFQLPGYAPASVGKCFDAMRRDLKTRLKIPADWP